jgi:hypothetical protein
MRDPFRSERASLRFVIVVVGAALVVVVALADDEVVERIRTRVAVPVSRR